MKKAVIETKKLTKIYQMGEVKVIALDDKDESREIVFEVTVFDLDFYLITALSLIIILLAILMRIIYFFLHHFRVLLVYRII